MLESGPRLGNEASNEAYRLRSLIIAEYVPAEDRALITGSYLFRNFRHNLLLRLIDYRLHARKAWATLSGIAGDAGRHVARARL